MSPCVLEQAKSSSLTIDIDTFPFGVDSSSLLLGKHGDLSVFYAPFEHVNKNAKVVIIGLTPGKQQAINALTELQGHYAAHNNWEKALAAAKVFASFSGPMRKNLVSMLNMIKLHELLGIKSCENLFESDCQLAHFTSTIRNPVFKNEKNYNGTPAIEKNEFLKSYASKWLKEELSLLDNPYIVPLGPKVEKALTMLGINQNAGPNRILSGLPHPSGANAERICYFLGRKDRAELSNKTNPDKIDDDLRRIKKQMSDLLSEANR